MNSKFKKIQVKAKRNARGVVVSLTRLLQPVRLGGKSDIKISGIARYLDPRDAVTTENQPHPAQ